METSLKKKILVVDDNLFLREVIGMFLSDDGYEVVNAQNGKVALDLLERLPISEYPSCIVLDVRMPVMDGNGFLDAIEKGANSELLNIPVIVYSADGLIRTHPQVIATLEKPLSIEILCGAIKGCPGISNQYLA